MELLTRIQLKAYLKSPNFTIDDEVRDFSYRTCTSNCLIHFYKRDQLCSDKMTAKTAPAGSKGGQGLMRSKNTKPEEIRKSNIQAAKALSDAVRTSLGPRGMDKMIQDAKSEVTITNDGATILNQMNVVHPAAKMLVELSKAQDIEAGDGTTSVVVMAGSLLDAADKLLQKGIHPTTISESFQKAAGKSVEILTSMATPLDLSDRESLLKAANTSLCSKVVSQNNAELSPIAVDAVLKIIDPVRENNVNLKDIKIIKKIGGTVDDTELVDGLVFEQKAANINGPKKCEKAKIGFIQFCVSPPKTDMDNQVVVSDYAAMDRVLREERAYILNIVKQIKKAGCNVLLIQKSILRDALSDLATHFFDKMKIMVVKDIEREDVEFLCKTLGCRPYRLPGPLHRREPRVGRDGGGGPDRVQQVCQDHRHGHARQDLLHHHS